MPSWIISSVWLLPAHPVLSLRRSDVTRKAWRLCLAVGLLAGVAVGAGCRGRVDREEAASGATKHFLTEADVLASARAPYANDLGDADTVIRQAIASYPPALQEQFQLFLTKCSTCHTVARSLFSEIATPPAWEHYIKKMWQRPGSHVGPGEATAIWEFLVYDSKIRKLDQPEVFQAYRSKLLAEFKRKYPERYRVLYAGHEDEAVILK